MLRKYYRKNKNKLLKYRFTDTSFIYSRNGGTSVKFNKYFANCHSLPTQVVYLITYLSAEEILVIVKFS